MGIFKRVQAPRISNSKREENEEMGAAEGHENERFTLIFDMAKRSPQQRQRKPFK